MRKSCGNLVLILILIGSFGSKNANSQGLKDTIIALPFSISVPEGQYQYLKEKLAKNIVEGPFYNSQYIYKGVSETDIFSFRPNSDYYSSPFDSATRQKFRTHLTSELHGKVLLTGSFSPSAGDGLSKYKLQVCLTDFDTINDSKIFPAYSLNELPALIDKACQFVNETCGAEVKPKLYFGGFKVPSGEIDFITYSMYLDFPLTDLYSIQGFKYGRLDTIPYTDIAQKNKCNIVVCGRLWVDQPDKKKNQAKTYHAQPQIYYAGNSLKHKPSALYSLSEVQDTTRDGLEELVLDEVSLYLELRPDDPSVKRTNAQLKQNCLDALQFYKRDLAIAYMNLVSDSVIKTLLKAEIALKDDSVAKVLSILNGMTENSTNQEFKFLKARALQAEGDFKKAISIYATISDTAASFNQLNYMMGKCYLSITTSLPSDSLQPYIDSAVYYFRKQCNLTPQFLEASLSLATCYQINFNRDSLEAIYKRVHEFDTLSAERRLPLIIFYADQADSAFTIGSYSKAINLYFKAYSVYPYSVVMKFAVMASIMDTITTDSSSLAKTVIAYLKSESLIDEEIYNNILVLMRFCDDKVSDAANDRLKTTISKRAEIVAQTYLQNSGSTYKIEAIYRWLGSIYYQIHDSTHAEKYYLLAKEKNASPADFLNLAEFYLTINRPDAAYKIIQEFWASPSLYSVDNLYGHSLSHFYAAECLANLNMKYNREMEQVKEDINKFNKEHSRTYSGELIFGTWEFKGFYDWLSSDKRLDQGIKNNMLRNLKVVLPASRNEALATQINL